MHNILEKINRQKIILWEALPNISGGQKVLLDIVSRLKDVYRFEAIVPSEGLLTNKLRQFGLKVHFIDCGNYNLGKKSFFDVLIFILYTPVILFKAVKIISSADIIYANCSRIFIWSSLVGIILRKKTIWHLHNVFVDRKSKLLINLFGKLCVVKKIIAVSNTAGNQFPSLRQKIEVIYNGVDTDLFKPKGNQNLEKKNKKYIGVISDLIPQKGHRTVIEALNIVKGTVNVKLLIVGDSRRENNGYKKSLIELVNRLELEKEVNFLGRRKDISNILNMLDLLVVPSSSLFEACPLVILEAFACGVPVIGSNLGGIPEVVEDGKTGRIFTANEKEDLAEKILSILTDQALLEEMKKNCRKIAEEKFDMNIFINEIELVLRKVQNKEKNEN